MRIYQHLSNEERFYIHQAVREGKTQKEIAVRLGSHLQRYQENFTAICSQVLIYITYY